MAAHLEKTTVEYPILALQNFGYRGRHVIVDPTVSDATIEGKGSVMGVKHHLRTLKGI